MSQNLTYEKFNKDKLAVRGDKELYGKLIKKMGGRWNSRLKGGEGWFVPIENEDKIKQLIETVNKGESIANLKAGAKSRKEQNKYRRAVSPSNSDHDSEFDSSDDESEKEPKKEVKKVEEPKKEVKKVEEPKKEVKKVEEPKKEVKKVEEPKKEVKKIEEPKKEVKKVEEPKKEVKRVEEPKKESNNDKIITKIISKSKPVDEKTLKLEDIERPSRRDEKPSTSRQEERPSLRREDRPSTSRQEERPSLRREDRPSTSRQEERPSLRREERPSLRREERPVSRHEFKRATVELKTEPKLPEIKKIRPDDKYSKYATEKIKFYQQFSKNDFEDISETSSDLEESSSDDFPSPSPIRNKHKKEDYSKLSKRFTK